MFYEKLKEQKKTKCQKRRRRKNKNENSYCEEVEHFRLKIIIVYGCVYVNGFGEDEEWEEEEENKKKQFRGFIL